MDRRRFIKLTAVTGASVALASCGHPENQIIRFIPEDEFVPGVETWKPSVCPLCAAGCGLNVRVMDADVDVVRNGQRGVVRATVAKKLEGLPTHPVNRGRLCSRGQAAIQVTYHPDRLRHPLKRQGVRGAGEFQEISWDDALKEVIAKLDELAQRPKSLGFLIGTQPGPRRDLMAQFTQRFGGQLVRVSLLDEEVLRVANAASFGRHQLPTVDLSRARFVISFGADFLGTWNSPVAQAAAYGDMRQGTAGQRGAFVQVESRMSQTGANADQWIPATPGSEGVLALGLAHVIMKSGLVPTGSAGRAGAAIPGWSGGLADFTPEAVEKATGVAAARVEQLARDFVSRRPSVAIIGGPALAQTNGLAQAMAVNALNALVGSIDVPGGVSFTPALPGAAASAPSAATMYQLAGQLASDPATYGVLLIDDVNPVFLAPKTLRLRESLEKAPFIVSFASFLDETSVLADVILPDHTFLESWTAVVPEAGSMVAAASVAAPVMRPLYSTRATADVLLDISRRLAKPLTPAFGWQTYDELLKERVSALPVGADVPDAWAAAQGKGGWWESAGSEGTKNKVQSTKNGTRDEERGTTAAASSAAAQVAMPPAEFDGVAETYPFYFLPYASTQFFDGSSAHLPWLQEMPDPMTSAMWSNWVEINPTTAAQLHIANGDMVEIVSSHGSVRAPAVVTPGIAPTVVAMPIGQGHTVFTRYATGRGSNPLEILGPFTQRETGTLAWAATRVRIARVGDGAGELTLFAGSAEEHPHQGR